MPAQHGNVKPSLHGRPVHDQSLLEEQDQPHSRSSWHVLGRLSSECGGHTSRGTDESGPRAALNVWGRAGNILATDQVGSLHVIRVAHLVLVTAEREIGAFQSAALLDLEGANCEAESGTPDRRTDQLTSDTK